MSSLKIDQLEEIAKVLNVSPMSLECFIETGTFRGETSKGMSSSFKKVITIEISEALYNKALRGFKDYANIEAHLGDSSVVLDEVIENNTHQENIVFFLDGHYSSRKTGRGKVDVPLLEELPLISKRNRTDIIVIDDYRLFGSKRKEDWSYISEEKIKECFKPNQIDKIIVVGDRLCILTKVVL